MNGQNILIVGVGGQGVVLASNLLAEAALAADMDVKKTDTLGMAQRGGSVISHLRYGESVASPLIPTGEADVLIAFEKLEGARWAHFLRPEGTAIINYLSIPPLSVTLGKENYPTDMDLAEDIRRFTRNIYVVPGSATAERLGNAKMVNTVLLGFASRFLLINTGLLKSAIEKALPKKLKEPNALAFEAGLDLVPLEF